MNEHEHEVGPDPTQPNRYKEFWASTMSAWSSATSTRAGTVINDPGNHLFTLDE